jgi:catechol 2,3-dioxygenase-like lactoylglutathione lyase family enzyme
VPTPPATSSPAIASARATGRLGSIVRTTPFSRITGENLDVFDHVTVRMSDPAASRRFYDLLFEALEFSDAPHENEDFVEWDDFSLLPVADEPPTRRLHVGFVARSRKQVDGFWARLTGAGYRDDGAPGLRPQYSESYYGAFVLDPDGNSIEAVHHDEAHNVRGIDHLWMRVADLAASKRFYEAVAPYTGFELRVETPSRASFQGERAGFSIVAGPPTENAHIAFPAHDDGTVDAFHRAATEAGYRDNGPPGERRVYHPGYYGAYVLDPDGNNVEVVNHNR